MIDGDQFGWVNGESFTEVVGGERLVSGREYKLSKRAITLKEFSDAGAFVATLEETKTTVWTPCERGLLEHSVVVSDSEKLRGVLKSREDWTPRKVREKGPWVGSLLGTLVLLDRRVATVCDGVGRHL